MSIANSLVWSYVERWGNKVITLLVFIVLARLLDPKDFGLVAFAKIFIDYLDSLGGQGLGFAIIQRNEINNHHLNTAFWINVLSGVFLAFLLILFSPLIEQTFSQQGIADVLKILAVVIVINALSRIQVAILTREQRFKELASRGLVMSLTGGVVGIMLALNGYGIWSLIFQQVTAALAAFMITWRTTSWRPRTKFSLSSAKEMYSFASKVVIDQQVLYLSKRLDEALIATFLGVTALGFYSISKRLFEATSDILYSALSKVLLPIFSRKQSDKLEVISSANNVTMYMAAIIFPIFMFGIVASNELIVLVFGEKWSASAVPFGLLMLSGMLLLAPNVIHSIFHAIGKPGVPLSANSVRALVSILSITIGSTYGLVGVVLGILVRDLVGAIFDFILFEREFGRNCYSNCRIQIFNFLYCLPMAAIIIAASYGWGGGGIALKIAYLIMLGLGTYLVTLIFFRAPALKNGISFARKYLERRRGSNK